jgi:hypothetical protein
MAQNQATMLGFGLALIGGGAFVFTRPAPSESAVYIRRIAGMMLLGLGLALSAFSVALVLAAGS